MKRWTLTITFFLLFLFSFFNLSFASAPQITASPSGTINIDQSFTVSATMSGLSKNAIYRLRIALSQPGTTDYFGSTFDGTSWHTGSISSGNSVAITTDGSGSWSGDIQGKIDPDDPNLTTGSGIYDLKIGRYTQTGSSATWSDPVSVTISVPSPTPIPPTPTQSPKPQMPTPNPPTAYTVVSPTQKIVLRATIHPTISVASISAEPLVLGTASAKNTPSPKIIVAQSHTERSTVIFLLLGSIIMLIGAGGTAWFFFIQKKHGNISNNDI